MRVIDQSISAVPATADIPIRVEWHDEWSPAVSRAFAAMPYDHLMDVEVVARLWEQAKGGGKQQIAVLRAGDAPVGVLPLKRRGRFAWQLLTQFVLPYARFYVLPPYTSAALAALGRYIACDDVAFYEFPAPAPSVILVPHESWVVRLEASYRALMARTGYTRGDRRCRARTAGLTLREDQYDELPLALEHWAHHWRARGHHYTANRKDELLAVFRVCQEQGRLKTFALYDGDRFAAMTINIVGPGTLYFMTTVMRDEYRPVYAGIRVLLAAMEWACANGFKEYDLLPLFGHYKRHWAEPVTRSYRLVRGPFGSRTLGLIGEGLRDVENRVRWRLGLMR
jgi:hypothetical protein